MRQYLDLMQNILDNGRHKTNRTGVGTLSLFGTQMRFDLQEGFPLVTTKKCHLKSIIHELLWFINGDTSVKSLNEHKVKIWDAWANDDGNLGPIYGFQWRGFNAPYPPDNRFERPKERAGVDQLRESLNLLRSDPDSRRNLVTAWNPLQLDQMALPPCHVLFQFDVTDGKLSCQMYQRSCDFFLGVPFNIASYSLLTMMMARTAGLELGDFVWVGADSHIYCNTIQQAKLQLTREPRPLPKMILEDRGQDLNDWKYEDFELVNYNPHPPIKAKVAV